MTNPNKKNFTEGFQKLMEKWINKTENYINEQCSIPEMKEFQKDYINVLNNAKKQIENKANDIWELYIYLDNNGFNEYLFFKNYVNALSFDININGKNCKVFLPSFSDEIFKQITRLSFMGLSPYRGIYYVWKLSEIQYLFVNGDIDKGKTELLNIYKEVEKDFFLQKNGNNYVKYLDSLNISKNSNLLSEVFNHQIKLVKKSLKELIFEIKRWFNLFLFYPSKTSSHFYLSGLRFYWLPLTNNCVKFQSDDRYYVQSIDSGIFKIDEHYGTLIDNDDPEAWEELLEKLPAGSLTLDLTKPEPTEIDRQNIYNFEIWSYLITLETYAVVSKTLNFIEMNFKKKGIAYFLNELRKNPMRKIYFDTGIYRIAELASNGNIPKISYLTTQKSRVDEPYFDISKKLLESFLDTNGIEYRLLCRNGWGSGFASLSRLTLIPSRGLIKSNTNMLLSIRDRNSRKIAHGMETSPYSFYLQNLEHNVKKEDLLGDFISLVVSCFGEIDGGTVISFLLFAKKLIKTFLNSEKYEDSIKKIKGAINQSQEISKKTIENLKL